MINFSGSAAQFYSEASQETRSSSQRVLEYLSASFSISSFKEHAHKKWTAILKPREAVSVKYNLPFEYLYIGNGYTNDFHADTLSVVHPSGEDFRIDKKILFVSSSAPQLKLICMQYAALNGKIVLPIDVNEVPSGDRAGDMRHLESALADALWVRDVFDESEPIANPAEFFGRDRFITSLLSKIGVGSPAAIFGLRKIGKSSILERLKHILTSDTSSLYLVTGHSCNSAQIKSGRWWNLASELIRGIHYQLSNFVSVQKLKFDIKPLKCQSSFSKGAPESEARFAELLIEDFGDLLKAAKSASEKAQRSGYKMVILFDEIDHIYPTREDNQWWKDDYFTFWNTIQAIKRGLEEPSLITYIICGVNPSGVELGSLVGKPNPLFETSKLYLGPMEEEDSFKMLNGLGVQVGMMFQRNATESMTAFTGGHPWLLRKLGHRIHLNNPARYLVLEITVDHVKRAIALGYAEFISHVDWILNHMKDVSAQEYRLLRDIAMGGNSKYTIEWANIAFREAYADHLVKYGLIEFKGSIPRLKFELLEKAFSQPASIGMSEQIQKLRDLVENVEKTIRTEIAFDLSKGRSPIAVVEAIAKSIPSDGRNRGKTSAEILSLGRDEGIDAMLMALNWGDYLDICRKFYDDINWKGSALEKEARIAILQSGFKALHLIRHNNEHEIKQRIEKYGFDKFYGELYQIGEMFMQ